MPEGWSKQLSVALPLGFLDQEQARAPHCETQDLCDENPLQQGQWLRGAKVRRKEGQLSLIVEILVEATAASLTL
jgi:hypothetical protein